MASSMFGNIFKVMVIAVTIPLILGNVFCVTWTGGAIKPSGVNTYYYPGKLDLFPAIKVYDDSIEIGSYNLKVKASSDDNNVTVYIDSLSPDKVFRIEVEDTDDVYFSLCGLGKGQYTLYIDGEEQFNSTGTCIHFTKTLTEDEEHTVKIEFVKSKEIPIPTSTNIEDWLPYILIGAIGILAVIYLKL